MLYVECRYVQVRLLRQGAAAALQSDDSDLFTPKLLSDDPFTATLLAKDQARDIYAEIDKLEPVQRQGRAVRPKIERYPLPLGLALAAGLLAFASRRRA